LWTTESLRTRSSPNQLRAICSHYWARSSSLIWPRFGGAFFAVPTPKSRDVRSLLFKFPKCPQQPIPIGCMQFPQLFKMSQSRLRLRSVVSAHFKPCYERPLVRDELVA
jgi:hypothetical protein